ncbi:hypothetical protein D3C75_474170 [compost metagenome]
MQITGCHHVDIHSGPDCLKCRFFIIFSRAVRDHLLDRCPVGDDDPVKAPFCTQQVTQQLTVTGCRNAVHDIERGHDHLGSGINCRFIRREIIFTQLPFGQVYSVIIPSAFGSAVSGKVLNACGHTGVIT